MQLRSGQLRNPPTRSALSAYSIFYREKLADMKKDGKKLSLGEFSVALSDMWKSLSEDQKEDYEEKYQKAEQKYKEELIIHYGGNQADLKKYKQLVDLPPRPKRPITGCLVYISEQRANFSEANPKLTSHQVTKELSEKYNSLPLKDKKKYDDNFEKQMNQYHKELEEWNKKYQTKSEQFNTLVEEKFKRTPSKCDLDYQELPPVKRPPKKLKENEETEPAQKKPEKQKDDKNAKNEGKGKADQKKEKDEKNKEDKKGDRRKSAGKKQ